MTSLAINTVIVYFLLCISVLFANPAHSTHDVSELSKGKKNHLHAEDFLVFITYSRMTQNYLVLATGRLKNCLRPEKGFLYVTW